MGTLIHRNGDMFTSDARALLQGVNVDGLMGAGLALQFARIHPDMKARYVALCRERLLTPGTVMVDVDKGITIYNVASQDRPGRHARYEWVESGVHAAIVHAEKNGIDLIAVPQIGCNIGGLEWTHVLPILERLAAATSVDLEVWTYGPTAPPRAIQADILGYPAESIASFLRDFDATPGLPPRELLDAHQLYEIPEDLSALCPLYIVWSEQHGHIITERGRRLINGIA